MKTNVEVMAKRGWTVKNLHDMMTCASRTLSKYAIGKTKVVLRSEKKLFSPRTNLMIKDISRISLVCSFAIFQTCNDSVWFSPHLVMRHIDEEARLV
jgi:hypothetical protein